MPNDNQPIQQSSSPENPSLDMLWIDTSITPNLLKKWNGLEWIIVSEADNTSLYEVETVDQFVSMDKPDYWQEDEPIAKNAGDIWVVPSTGVKYKAIGAVGRDSLEFAYDDDGNLLYESRNGANVEYEASVDENGYLIIDADGEYLIIDNRLYGTGIWIEKGVYYMNIKNLVFNRAIRGIMFDRTTKQALWSVSQLKNFRMQVTTEKETAVDAMNSPIMDFYRAKSGTLSADSALFDLGLFAAQSGDVVDASTATNKFIIPVFDEVTLTDATSATLTYNPYLASGADYAVPYIYVMNGDGTLGEVLTADAQASAGKFSISGKNLTFAANDLNVGDTILAVYDREVDGTNEAVQVKNSATKFPKNGKFVLEYLAADPCDSEMLYYCYNEIPNAQLSPDIDLEFATDMTHSFELDMKQEYCDKEKLLYRMICPDA